MNLYANALLLDRKYDLPATGIRFEGRGHVLSIFRLASNNQVSIELDDRVRHVIDNDVQVELKGTVILVHLGPSAAEAFDGESVWVIDMYGLSQPLGDIRAQLELIFAGASYFTNTLSTAPVEALALGKDSFEWPLPCGFVAGTPVLTKRGLVAIDLLVAGDLVFSRNEVSGQQTFREIVRTFSFTDKAVYMLEFPSDGSASGATVSGATVSATKQLVSSSAQPYWTGAQQQGDSHIPALWRRCDHISPSGALLKAANGTSPEAMECSLVWRTLEQDAGWVNLDSFSYNSDSGYRVAFHPHEVVRAEQVTCNDHREWLNDWDGIPDDCDGTLKRTVYNIEVAVDHTYFVGTQGIWVHDMSQR